MRSRLEKEGLLAQLWSISTCDVAVFWAFQIAIMDLLFPFEPFWLDCLGGEGRTSLYLIKSGFIVIWILALNSFKVWNFDRKMRLRPDPQGISRIISVWKTFIPRFDIFSVARPRSAFAHRSLRLKLGDLACRRCLLEGPFATLSPLITLALSCFRFVADRPILSQLKVFEAMISRFFRFLCGERRIDLFMAKLIKIYELVFIIVQKAHLFNHVIAISRPWALLTFQVVVLESLGEA